MYTDNYLNSSSLLFQSSTTTSPHHLPGTQTYFGNSRPTIGLPISHPIQPQLVPIPIDRPYAVPVPYPVSVPVPQPYSVLQPMIVQEKVAVPVPVPVSTQPDYYSSPTYSRVERIVEEPIYIKRCRRRRKYCSRSCSSSPLPSSTIRPIIIPITIQTSSPNRAPLQITEYVQDIYFPPQVYTTHVSMG